MGFKMIDCYISKNKGTNRIMEYKIAVCDDCVSDADYLEMLVMRWAEKVRGQVRILKFNSARTLLFHYEEEKDFDILLLDIEMDGQNGVELAKEIRRNNDVVQIVFITGFPDYMDQGYEVDALHYLLKPVCEEKLYDVLGRAAARLKKTERCLKVTFD